MEYVVVCVQLCGVAVGGNRAGVDANLMPDVGADRRAVEVSCHNFFLLSFSQPR